MPTTAWCGCWSARTWPGATPWPSSTSSPSPTTVSTPPALSTSFLLPSPLLPRPSSTLPPRSASSPPWPSPTTKPHTHQLKGEAWQGLVSVARQPTPAHRPVRLAHPGAVVRFASPPTVLHTPALPHRHTPGPAHGPPCRIATHPARLAASPHTRPSAWPALPRRLGPPLHPTVQPCRTGFFRHGGLSPP